MALREILNEKNMAVGKVSREVTEYNDRLITLLDDMADTLIDSGGVGLAAPQVGILRRVALVLETNVDEDEDEFILELINPTIVKTEGEQCGSEGCLSIPGEFGIVTRPDVVTVRAFDRDGEAFEYVGEGLTARAFCHEIDHLDGIMFTERAERMLSAEEVSEMMIVSDEEIED